MAAGRATTWLLLAVPGLAAIAICAAIRTDPGAPDAPPAEPAPVATAIAATPATVHESGLRADDGSCLAQGHDPDDRDETSTGGSWVLGTDECRWVDAPVVHITGHLVDSAGAPVGAARLRFWSRDSMKNAPVGENGEFDLTTDEDDVVYDVDAIVGEVDDSGVPARRLHVGRVKSGEHDVVLRMNAAPAVLAAGTLLDEQGLPLAGWTVEAYGRHARGGSCCIGSARTDGAGRFRLSAWTYQPVTLRASSPRGTWRPIQRQERDDGTRELRVFVEPTGIAGRVVVEPGGSPAGAVVTLRAEPGGNARKVVVDDGGRFHFDRLDASAVYHLSVELSGYVGASVGGWSAEAQDARLVLLAPAKVLDGRVVDAAGAPLANTWIRFVSADGRGDVQSMTDADGSFATADARGVPYDAFVLVTGADGRLVPGPKLGRVRGGDRGVTLRAAN